MDAIRRQFFGNRPHHLFAWPSPPPPPSPVVDSNGTDTPWSWSRPELQEVIVRDILDWGLARDLMPAPEYTFTFLKRYMRAIEMDGHEPHERIVEVCCLVAGGSDPAARPGILGSIGASFTLKTWFLDQERYISTVEHQSTISGGTTGLKTWHASLAMAEYFIAHPDVIRSKSVVELGAGVGMLGLVMAELGAKSITVTDVHPEVLKLLQQNVDLYKRSTTKINVGFLDWFETTDLEHVPMVPDVLVCADTAYDPDLLPGLCTCISAFFAAANGNELTALLATSIRREETFQVLWDGLVANGLQPQVFADNLDTHWFPGDETGAPIRLLSVKPIP
ncbi:putative methyltransferase-domain-containing protein [Blastocladiella britannica]|nr:putative methyltransferase-domain-containing protein [Blastocladiella britannica]